MMEQNGMIRRTFPPKSAKWSRPFNPEKDGIKEVIEFHIFERTHGNAVRHKDYETWPEELLSYLKNFYTLEVFHTEYGIEFSFQLIVNQKAEFKQFQEEINFLLPYVTRIDSKGFYQFNILDHELSEFETRKLDWNPKTGVSKITGVVGNKITGTLEECFNVIRSNYYYE